MNPWAILAVVLAFGAGCGGSYLYGMDVGADGEIAKQAKLDDTVRQVKEAAQQGAAEAIAKIKPRNVTIQQEIEREIQTRVEYRDCRHSPDQLRRLNEALTGRADAPGSGELPGTVPPR